MKTTFFNSKGRSNSSRTILVLAAIFVFSLGLVSGLAQDKTKRITSLQLGEGAEGSRVTIVSDAALNDYEAFRRGDRFYVRIPAGEFAAAQPSFQGEGFDDVQVQRVGDSVVISFKLQPGASARVDQRSNKLDVIFSSPARLARNENAVRNRVASPAAGSVARTSTTRNTQRNVSDAAGPVPPGSPEPSEPKTFSGTSITDGSTPALPVAGRRSASGTRDELKFTQTQSNSGVPTSTPSTQSAYVPPPAPSAYPAAPVSTPFNAAQKPAVASSSLSQRREAVTRWISANRTAALTGAVVLVALALSGAVILFRRKRKSFVKTKRVDVPRVQPKYVPDLELDELLSDRLEHSPANSGSFINDFEFDTSENDVVNTGAFEFQSSLSELLKDDDLSPTIEPDVPAEVVTPRDDWASPMSSLHPSTFSTYQREEQEREVFEL